MIGRDEWEPRKKEREKKIWLEEMNERQEEKRERRQIDKKVYCSRKDKKVYRK